MLSGIKKYSIIIPHFTKKGTILLDRAIASIPKQEDIEIIVVDNSFTPINSDLYKSIPSVKIYYSDNSRGAGGARNVGLSVAQGKWLLFMDADDYFTPNAFESFDRYFSSDNDIVFFKPTSLYPETGELADRHYVFCDEIDQYLITGNEYDLRYREFDVPWAKMFRRKFVIDNNILFDEVPASNDVMFSLKTGIAAKKIAASKDTVYCVTVTKGSITNVKSLRNLESDFNVRIRKNALLVSRGLKRECSLLNPIIKSRHYGIKTMFKFLFKAIRSGNLLVGYNRWFKTLFHLKKSKVGYIVEE